MTLPQWFVIGYVVFVLFRMFTSEGVSLKGTLLLGAPIWGLIAVVLGLLWNWSQP